MLAEKKWYPVYTHARAEKAAAVLLVKKGIETYLPLQKQLKQWSDRKKWVEEPLIKSYLFVHITVHEMAEVLMTKGISRFLYFAGNAATMPERQIEDLRLLLASEHELEVTSADLQPGEKVVIKAGLLMGMRGELVSYKSQKTLVIRFEQINQSIIIQTPLSFVDRV